ncbi:MAG: magnesium and cobalt exporter, family [Sphingomonadales bacterium]|jgi:putative hemolysin|nr:magnesium and cobalt exporter, family [Sphingomonadales bacterium]
MPANAPLAPFPWLDVLIILLLVGLNGLFAMSELAVVSSRKPRLKAMARAGRRGAQTALDLASDPGRFLSAVQIGITLIGILAGAYSGASLGGPTGQRIALLGVDPNTAATLGFVLVIVLTTYASLVIGELVPKQFALRSPETIAALVAGPMRFISKVTAPFVWLLDRTSALVFRLLRMNRESGDHVTAEDLHLVVAEAATAGVLEESERAMISSVVRLADRPTREVMTPRTEVSWIDADADVATVRQKLIEAPHNRIPVAEGSVDRLIGVVQARDIVSCLLVGKEINLRELMKPAPVVPDQLDAMDAMTVLRDSEVPMAFVHDEYGHFEGLVTPGGLLTAMAGKFLSSADFDTDPPLVERDDGSWWVSGSVSADAMADNLCFRLPDDRDFATAAGFALSVLKHLPEVGERFTYRGWQFEISDMDGRKIDKMLAMPVKRGRRA